MALVHLSSSTEEGIFDDRYVQKNGATLHHPIILMKAELTTEELQYTVQHPPSSYSNILTSDNIKEIHHFKP